MRYLLNNRLADIKETNELVTIPFSKTFKVKFTGSSLAHIERILLFEGSY